jgi:hypothetical protein
MGNRRVLALFTLTLAAVLAGGAECGPARDGGQPAGAGPTRQQPQPGPDPFAMPTNTSLSHAVYLVTWQRERAFTVHWTDVSGEHTHVQRAQHAQGGWFQVTVNVLPGQVLSILATPEPHARNGKAVCSIAWGGRTIAGPRTVDDGPVECTARVPR